MEEEVPPEAGAQAAGPGPDEIAAVVQQVGEGLTKLASVFPEMGRALEIFTNWAQEKAGGGGGEEEAGPQPEQMVPAQGGRQGVPMGPQGRM